MDETNTNKFNQLHTMRKELLENEQAVLFTYD